MKKLIEISKKIYYQNRLLNQKAMWSALKELAEKEKIVTPKKLISGGEYITSPKKIAQTLNDFFFSRVEQMRATFTPGKNEPNKPSIKAHSKAKLEIHP